MKQLSNGNFVSIDTPTKFTDEGRVLLTPTEITARQVELDSTENKRRLKSVYSRRNTERGTWQEQWEFFLDNGYSALVARDNNIKARYPKPTKKK